MHFSRLVLHFMLCIAIFANGFMVTTASAMSHSTDAAMQSHDDEHARAGSVHDSHELLSADHHSSQMLAASEHSHHPAVAGKCRGKACQQKCKCGCGMGFCSSNVASLFGSPSASFLLKGSDAVPSPYDPSFAATCRTSPLRPPIV